MGAPLAYGLGTGLPVLVLGWLMALGVSSASGVVSAVQRVEPWLRVGTGVLFIVVGLYYALVYVFRVEILG